MKKNTKKIYYKSIFTKITLFIISVLLIITVPMQLTKNASADEYDNQINLLQQQIQTAQAEADILASQANTYRNAIAKLQNQIDIIQSEINVSQIQYEKLVAQIIKTEEDIKNNKDALGKTIADMYVDDNITPIEMIASSNSISDFIDKQEYRSSIRNQLSVTISKIKDLKMQLEEQKKDVEIVLNKQKAQHASLDAARSEQQNLLEQTRGQEAVYQQLISDSRQQLEAVAAQQRAYYQSLLNSGNDGSAGVYGSFEWTNWSGNQGCGGDGYPYCGIQDSYSDPWMLYNRECVSYAAWAISERYGRYVSPFYGNGNAYQWVTYGPYYSGAIRVYNPQAGDAVVLPIIDGFSPLGHLMVVESVSGDWVHVSQYNYWGTGEYSTMDIRNSGVVFLRFPPKIIE
ncbi:MAG TPA: CHAP domain-containing protein [Candidatus Saccharibacteria bacterium]|nr:CHAP domain-containing protein [Candidatus Saccharibacteria bacterium]